MRLFRKFVLLLAALVAMGGLALPVASASTSQAHQVHKLSYVAVQVNPTTFTNVLSKAKPAVPLAGNWILRTRTALGNQYLEVTAEGDGRNMEVHATGFSTFYRSQPAGAQGWIFTTPNGLCAHALQAGAVQGSSSKCGASNTGSQWFDDGNGRLENSAYQKFMGVDTLAEGSFVLDESGTGAYYITYQNIG